METTKDLIIAKFTNNLEFTGEESYYIRKNVDCLLALQNLLSSQETVIVLAIHKATKTKNAKLLLDAHTLSVMQGMDESRLENLYDIANGHQDIQSEDMTWQSRVFQAGTSLLKI